MADLPLATPVAGQVFSIDGQERVAVERFGRLWCYNRAGTSTTGDDETLEIANALLSVGGAASFVRQTDEGYVVKELRDVRYTLVFTNTSVTIYQTDGTVGDTVFYSKLFIET